MSQDFCKTFSLAALCRYVSETVRQPLKQCGNLYIIKKFLVPASFDCDCSCSMSKSFETRSHLVPGPIVQLVLQFS